MLVKQSFISIFHFPFPSGNGALCENIIREEVEPPLKSCVYHIDNKQRAQSTKSLLRRLLLRQVLWAYKGIVNGVVYAGNHNTNNLCEKYPFNSCSGSTETEVIHRTARLAA